MERAAIVMEGEQWRALFSQKSNDFENLQVQLNEAQTMIMVLQEDLRERTEQVATLQRLEQEYTRATIDLQDQLRGSMDRVNFLEAEFQALDAYRQAKVAGNAKQAPKRG